jgi:hypothetical protein
MILIILGNHTQYHIFGAEYNPILSICSLGNLFDGNIGLIRLYNMDPRQAIHEIAEAWILPNQDLTGSKARNGATVGIRWHSFRDTGAFFDLLPELLTSILLGKWRATVV